MLYNIIVLELSVTCDCVIMTVTTSYDIYHYAKL